MNDSFDKTFEKIKEAENKPLKKVYDLLIRIFSLAMLVATVYAALFVSAGSALVLGLIFLCTWFIWCLRWSVVVGFKGYAEGKKAELDKDLAFRQKNNLPV